MSPLRIKREHRPGQVQSHVEFSDAYSLGSRLVKGPSEHRMAPYGSEDLTKGEGGPRVEAARLGVEGQPQHYLRGADLDHDVLHDETSHLPLQKVSQGSLVSDNLGRLDSAQRDLDPVAKGITESTVGVARAVDLRGSHGHLGQVCQPVAELAVPEQAVELLRVGPRQVGSLESSQNSLVSSHLEG